MDDKHAVTLDDGILSSSRYNLNVDARHVRRPLVFRGPL
jgi:hypothetical protein